VPKVSTSAQISGSVLVKTSLGVTPWLVVVSPIPRLGNITASNATIAATTAIAVEVLGAGCLLIALLLS